MQLLGGFLLAALRALFESLLPLLFARKDSAQVVEGKLERWTAPDAGDLVARGRSSGLVLGLHDDGASLDRARSTSP